MKLHMYLRGTSSARSGKVTAGNDRYLYSVTLHIISSTTTGHAKKVIPSEKFCISGTVADSITQFAAFIDEDTGYISCKRY